MTPEDYVSVGEIPKPTPQTKYSQPLPQSVSRFEQVIVRAGFIGKGANKQPGFLFVRKTKDGYKEERVEATQANQADERPRSFFSALGRLWAGGQR